MGEVGGIGGAVSGAEGEAGGGVEIAQASNVLFVLGPELGDVPDIPVRRGRICTPIGEVQIR